MRLTSASLASLLRRRGGTPNFSIMKRQKQRYGLGDRALDPVDPASERARLNHDLARGGGRTETADRTTTGAR